MEEDLARIPTCDEAVCAPIPSFHPQNRTLVIGMGFGICNQPSRKPIPLHQSARRLTHTDDELYTQVSTLTGIHAGWTGTGPINPPSHGYRREGGVMCQGSRAPEAGRTKDSACAASAGL